VGSVGAEAESKHQAAYYLLRVKLLWFCNNLLTYLTSLVLAPTIADMRERLLRAVDVDEMIQVHSTFVRQITSGCCLHPKLHPIRECILDVLDLALRLDDVQQMALGKSEEEQETFELPPSVTTRKKTGSKNAPSMYKSRINEDDDHGSHGSEMRLGDILPGRMVDDGRTPGRALSDISRDFDRHLRFIAAGLRGVARASREDQAPGWDLLAEMLEVGISELR
jgi:gamma-tubulin complex component 5